MRPFADNRLQIAPEKLKCRPALLKILLFYTRSHNDWCGFFQLSLLFSVSLDYTKADGHEGVNLSLTWTDVPATSLTGGLEAKKTVVVASDDSRLADSGWITLTSNVKYRKIGNIVEVRGDAASRIQTV